MTLPIIDGRIAFEKIGANRTPWTPTTFGQGYPSWITPGGSTGGSAPTHSLVDATAGAPRAVMTTAAVFNAYTELVGPAIQLRRHRALALTIGGWYADTASSALQRQFGFFTDDVADGGVTLLENGDPAGPPDDFARIQVRRSGSTPGTVYVPTSHSLVSQLEYRRRQTRTLLLYRMPDALNDWWCALLIGELEQAQVAKDVPIFAGNSHNGASILDSGTVYPRVRTTAKAAVARSGNVQSMRFDVWNY